MTAGELPCFVTHSSLQHAATAGAVPRAFYEAPIHWRAPFTLAGKVQIALIPLRHNVSDRHLERFISAQAFDLQWHWTSHSVADSRQSCSIMLIPMVI